MSTAMFLVCGSAEFPSTVVGATVMRCTRCSKAVNVSPSAFLTVLSGAKPLCIPCSLLNIVERDGPVTTVVLDAQIEEMSEVLGRRVARQEMERVADTFRELSESLRRLKP